QREDLLRQRAMGGIANRRLRRAEPAQVRAGRMSAGRERAREDLRKRSGGGAGHRRWRTDHAGRSSASPPRSRSIHLQSTAASRESRAATARLAGQPRRALISGVTSGASKPPRFPPVFRIAPALPPRRPPRAVAAVQKGPSQSPAAASANEKETT